MGRPAQAVDMNTPGGKVREARLKRGWSTPELGRRVGISHQSIVRTELGQTQPDRTTWIRLAQELKAHFGLEWLRQYAIDDNETTVPIKARVAAGDAVEFFLEGEDTDSIVVDPRMVFKKGDYFALRVDGESMEDAHILTGDIVLVREWKDKKQRPRLDDIVVADIRAEGITLKRWTKEDDEVVLLPASKSHKPIRRPDWRVKPVAVVVGVIRMMG